MALGRDLRRISIHAPQWGATRYDGSGGRPRHFNPRTPVGCDVAQMVENGATVKISIHAPQWGATSRRRTGPASTRNFNPRTPVGCDGMWWTAAARRRYFNPRTPVGCDFSSSLTESGVEEFQSTHPSGVRRTGVTSTRYHGQFQSTHPSGVRRHVQRAVGEQLVISIHAPQWGATYGEPTDLRALSISIHAPQWGATARMGIAFHNMEAPSVLKTDFIAKIHVHRSIHKFSNQKHQQTIHF